MNGEETRLICIACPKGCRLTVRRADAASSQAAPEPAMVVEGNRCPKGEIYGREEVLAPRRTVTAAMRTGSDEYPCVPVRTDRPLLRGLVRDLLRELYAGTVGLPVKIGDPVVKDWRGTGVSVVSTRTLPPDRVPAPREPGAEPEGDDPVAAPE